MKRDQTLIPVDDGPGGSGAALPEIRADLAPRWSTRAGRLVGQITVDDIVHIIQEEAGEDVLLLSGAGDGDINEPIRDSLFGRVRWLVANLGTALVASFIIACSAPRSRTGGARGADADRRLDRRQCRHADDGGLGARAGDEPAHPLQHPRIIWRELRVALLNGATIAVLIGLGTAAIFANPRCWAW
jgi:magnesium transporter